MRRWLSVWVCAAVGVVSFLGVSLNGLTSGFGCPKGAFGRALMTSAIVLREQRIAANTFFSAARQIRVEWDRDEGQYRTFGPEGQLWFVVSETQFDAAGSVLLSKDFGQKFGVAEFEKLRNAFGLSVSDVLQKTPLKLAPMDVQLDFLLVTFREGLLEVGLFRDLGTEILQRCSARSFFAAYIVRDFVSNIGWNEHKTIGTVLTELRNDHYRLTLSSGSFLVSRKKVDWVSQLRFLKSKNKPITAQLFVALKSEFGLTLDQLFSEFGWNHTTLMGQALTLRNLFDALENVKNSNLPRLAELQTQANDLFHRIEERVETVFERPRHLFDPSFEELTTRVYWCLLANYVVYPVLSQEFRDKTIAQTLAIVKGEVHPFVFYPGVFLLAQSLIGYEPSDSSDKVYVVPELLARLHGDASVLGVYKISRLLFKFAEISKTHDGHLLTAALKIKDGIFPLIPIALHINRNTTVMEILDHVESIPVVRKRGIIRLLSAFEERGVLKFGCWDGSAL